MSRMRMEWRGKGRNDTGYTKLLLKHLGEESRASGVSVYEKNVTMKFSWRCYTLTFAHGVPTLRQSKI